MLGFAIANIARETRVNGDKPLLVYTQIPRDAAPGQSVTAQFTLDSALQNPDDKFERVSLRLNRETQSDFHVVAVNPPSDSTEMRGRGRYYLWKELPRNTTLKITLRSPPENAKNGGVLRLHATLWAASYQQFEVRASIATTGAKAALTGRALGARAPIQNPREMAR